MKQRHPSMVLTVAMPFLIAITAQSVRAINLVVDALHGNDASAGTSGTGGLSDLASLDFSTAKRTIGAAIAGASPGDVIFVNAGVYAESVLPTAGITLMAVGEAIIGDIGGIGINIFNQPNVTVDGFTVRNCGDRGVYVDGASSVARLRNLTIYGCPSGMSLNTATIIVQRSIIRDCAFTGLGAAATGSPVLTVEQCTIVNCQIGVALGNTSSGYSIRNNIIALNVDRGISMSNPGALIDFNDVYLNGANYFGAAAPGANDISVDPVFVDYSRRILHLQAGSPLRNAGELIGGGPRVTIGAREVGRFSSPAADAWVQWTDSTGAAVTASAVVEIDPGTGHIVLKSGETSAAVRSPVLAGSLKSVEFSALQDVTQPAGQRRVIDQGAGTLQREIRYRGSPALFGANDASPAFVPIFEGQELGNVGHQFIQVELTLRRDGN